MWLLQFKNKSKNMKFKFIFLNLNQYNEREAEIRKNFRFFILWATKPERRETNMDQSMLLNAMIQGFVIVGQALLEMAIENPVGTIIFVIIMVLPISKK